MILIIDNYDSFTYNLYQYFCMLGADVLVRRNDEVTIEDIEVIAPSHLVISPGPGNPDQAGISLMAIRHFSERLPILGVCLGHQALGQVFGAHVGRSRRVMHGKSCEVFHRQRSVFRDLKRPLVVGRYHSLVLENGTIPGCLEITAWSEVDHQFDEVMAIHHRTLPLVGLQFHPESILTEQGAQLLANFLSYG